MAFISCLLDIDEDFKRELRNLVPLLLAPENLVEKEISGSKVTCRDLVEYFKVGKLPLNDFVSFRNTADLKLICMFIYVFIFIKQKSEIYSLFFCFELVISVFKDI